VVKSKMASMAASGSSSRDWNFPRTASGSDSSTGSIPMQMGAFAGYVAFVRRATHAG